jgi:hypothetical protein
MRVGPFVASMGGESLRKTDLISAAKQSDLSDSSVSQLAALPRGRNEEVCQWVAES